MTSAVSKSKYELEAVEHILRNLRQSDADELYAQRWDRDPDSYALVVDSLPTSMCDVFWHQGEPASLIGAYPLWPGVWSVFAFGTDKWDKCVVSLTKHARRFLMPAIYNSGFHRAQAWSVTSHTRAHRWMVRCLGARHEATHVGWGAGGEDFHCFMWDRPAVKAMIRQA